MQIALVVVVVLVAVLVVAAIPVLIQLRATLRSAQQVLDRVGPRLESALGEITEAADRLNRMAGELEERAKAAKPLFEAAAALGDQVLRFRGPLSMLAKLAGAVGPALIAALVSFNRRSERREEPEPASTSGKEARG